MKRNDDLRILLISLFINIVWSYFYGFRFKSDLMLYFSEQIYYQFLVFVSLCIPIIIKKCYFETRRYILNYKLEKFRSTAATIDSESLDEDAKKMLLSIVDNNPATSHKIKQLYDDIQDTYKS